MNAGALSGEPFDYLFSIVNMRILPPEIVAIPRKRAINFHDGPLARLRRRPLHFVGDSARRGDLRSHLARYQRRGG